MKIFKTVKNVIVLVFAVFFIATIAVVGVARIQGKTPDVLGYRLYVITTGSMEPEISVGDVIVGKKFELGDKLAVNDVVTYIGEVGELAGKTITHKIIKIEGSGENRTILTQGVANDTSDPPVAENRIQSVMTYKTVVLPFLYKILTSLPGFIFLVICPLVLMIVTELISVVKEIRKQKEQTNETKKGGQE